MATVFEEIENLKHQYEEAVQSKGQQVIDFIFADLFEKNPEIESATWQQYTPYFNDGEACIFSVGSVYLGIDKLSPAVKGEGEDWFQVDGLSKDLGFFSKYNFGTWARDENGKLLKNENGAAYKLFDSLDEERIYTSLCDLNGKLQTIEDVLETVFGDHCQVTVTKTGYIVSEYDHD